MQLSRQEETAKGQKAYQTVDRNLSIQDETFNKPESALKSKRVVCFVGIATLIATICLVAVLVHGSSITVSSAAPIIPASAFLTRDCGWVIQSNHSICAENEFSEEAHLVLSEAASTSLCLLLAQDNPRCGGTVFGHNGGPCTCLRAGEGCIPQFSEFHSAIWTGTCSGAAAAPAVPCVWGAAQPWKYCGGEEMGKIRLAAMATTELCMQLAQADPRCGNHVYGVNGGSCTCMRTGEFCVLRNSTRGSQVFSCLPPPPEAPTTPVPAVNYSALTTATTNCWWHMQFNNTLCSGGEESTLVLSYRATTELCLQLAQNNPRCGNTVFGRNGGSCTCMRPGEICIPRLSTRGSQVHTGNCTGTPAATQCVWETAPHQYCGGEETGFLELAEMATSQMCLLLAQANPRCGNTAWGHNGGTCTCLRQGEVCTVMNATSWGANLFTCAQPPGVAPTCGWTSTPNTYCGGEEGGKFILAPMASTALCQQMAAADWRCGQYFYGPNGGQCTCLAPGAVCMYGSSVRGSQVSFNPCPKAPALNVNPAPIPFEPFEP